MSESGKSSVKGWDQYSNDDQYQNGGSNEQEDDGFDMVGYYSNPKTKSQKLENRQNQDEQDQNEDEIPDSNTNILLPLSYFCQDYQKEICSQADQCTEYHKFTVNNKLKRIFKNNQVIRKNQYSGLWVLGLQKELMWPQRYKNLSFLAYRQDSTVYILQYDCLQKQVYRYVKSIPIQPRFKYYYFQCSQRFVYWAIEGHIGIIDLITKFSVKCAVDRFLKVTGMISIRFSKESRFGELFVSFKNGGYKIFSVDCINNKLTLNHIKSGQITQRLKQVLKKQSIPEAVFLKKFHINKKQIFAAGTADGRLILWIDENPQIFQMDTQYKNIWEIKFILVETSDSFWFYIINAKSKNQNTALLMTPIFKALPIKPGYRIEGYCQPLPQRYGKIQTLKDHLFVEQKNSKSIHIYKVLEYYGMRKIGFIYLHTPLLNIVGIKTCILSNSGFYTLFIIQDKQQTGNIKGYASMFSLQD